MEEYTRNDPGIPAHFCWRNIMSKHPLSALLVLLLGVILALPCVASDTPDEYMAKAATAMNSADVELAKADGKFDEGHSELAKMHMDEAMHDYKKAVEDLAKAVLPEGSDGAIKAMDDGLDKLEKSLKELEKGNYDKANELYAESQADFDTAAELLGY